MNEREAFEVSRWRYLPPYSDYDMECDPEDLLGRSYCAVVDGRGDLVGYCCFGGEAQVPGGGLAGAYGAPDGLDVGLGLRPDLTGQGLGAEFLRAVLDYAARQFAPATFRLTVATWNHRAIRAYVKAGFVPEKVFRSPTPRGDWEFLLMSRKAERASPHESLNADP